MAGVLKLMTTESSLPPPQQENIKHFYPQQANPSPLSPQNNYPPHGYPQQTYQVPQTSQAHTPKTTFCSEICFTIMGSIICIIIMSVLKYYICFALYLY